MRGWRNEDAPNAISSNSFRGKHLLEGDTKTSQYDDEANDRFLLLKNPAIEHSEGLRFTAK